MATSRQEFEHTIRTIVAQIHADETQRDKYPINAIQWNAFDDKMVEGYKQLITESIAFERSLALHIVVAFNLEQQDANGHTVGVT